MSTSDKKDIKTEVFSVIKDCMQILRTLSWERLRDFTEEDTKVKLVLPFFEIFGWDPLNVKDVEMEASFFHSEIGKTSQVDCVLWALDKPYIFLETKSLNSNLPDPRYNKKAERMLKYAKRNNASYGIFTNFLSMDIYDPESLTRVDNYPDPSYYLIKLDALSRILTKPERPKQTALGRDLPECFGSYLWNKPECSNCNYVKPIQVMCRTHANLKRHGIETQENHSGGVPLNTRSSS